ncbi:MAG: hypothetical protein IKP73_14295 [Bacteroidales bacterium]|nr:hypothetical protein [Bacteroidales bacterium]
MSELQQKIDTILQKRKVGVENIVAQEKVIADLKAAIFDIKKRIRESNLENADSYVPRLEEADKKLSAATLKLDHLKNRFDRETINVGVAGVTHAGKSTLLQAISGLDNEVLPKAVKGDNYAEPTTATRSQIYNGAKGAEIEFRSETDFLDFVNEYVEKIESVSIPKFYSVGDFEAYDFAAIEEQIAIGNETSNYKRLRGIQEAFKHFQPYLTGKMQPIPANRFDELKNFVKYSYDKPENRLYPAVKNIKIRNTFCGIDPELKLGLIDLPGFGENDNVDKIMIKGLENDVDFAILIIRPSNTDAGLLAKGISNFDRINEVQKGISKRSNFLSILINKDLSLGDLLDECVVSAKKSINELYNRNGENFTTFEFPLEVNGTINQDEVSNMLNKILGNLINVLPKMDEELLEAYKKTLDISDVKALCEEIMGLVRSYNTQNRDAAAINKKAISFHNKLRTGLRKLYFQKDAKYNCGNLPNIDDKEITKLVYEIKERVDGHINGDFWVVPDDPFPGFDNWEDYINANFEGQENQWVAQEMHRLWVNIIKEYETLDDSFFKKKLQQVKKDIVDVFKSVTGTLVTEENEDAAIEQTITLLRENGFKDTEPILDALIFLKSLKIDFRQNIYPMFYKYSINEILA